MTAPIPHPVRHLRLDGLLPEEPVGQQGLSDPDDPGRLQDACQEDADRRPRRDRSRRQGWLARYGPLRHHQPQGEWLSLIHISEPTRLLSISYAVFCLNKKKTK